MRKSSGSRWLVVLALGCVVFDGCHTAPGTFARRRGDEIIVAGRLFHTGTRVVTWIETANMGADPAGETKELDEWYRRDAHGQTVLKVPERIKDPMILTPNFSGRPARPEAVRGVVQGTDLVQYDFTPQQYAALIKLT